jgi:hypothetical protein
MVDLAESRDYQASLHLVLADGWERPLDRAIIALASARPMIAREMPPAITNTPFESLVRTMYKPAKADTSWSAVPC